MAYRRRRRVPPGQDRFTARELKAIDELDSTANMKELDGAAAGCNILQFERLQSTIEAWVVRTLDKVVNRMSGRHIEADPADLPILKWANRVWLGVYTQILEDILTTERYCETLAAGKRWGTTTAHIPMSITEVVTLYKTINDESYMKALVVSIGWGTAARPRQLVSDLWSTVIRQRGFEPIIQRLVHGVDSLQGKDLSGYHGVKLLQEAARTYRQNAGNHCR